MRSRAGLTFWRWRWSCWLRAFLARAAASFCARSVGAGTLGRLTASWRCARSGSLALACEPALEDGWEGVLDPSWTYRLHL